MNKQLSDFINALKKAIKYHITGYNCIKDIQIKTIHSNEKGYKMDIKFSLIERILHFQNRNSFQHSNLFFNLKCNLTLTSGDKNKCVSNVKTSPFTLR